MGFDLGAGLARLYRRFNRREFVHPDPLEVVCRYDSPADMEIAALLSATLAYGRVAQILASVDSALARLSDAGGSPSPRKAVEGASKKALHRAFSSFKHRFTTGSECADLILAARRGLEEHGSLETLFVAGCAPRDPTILPALALFVEHLRELAGSAESCPSLLSSPSDGSACKRLNLFLRWMVRRDAVDPGPWSSVSAAGLVVPLDTHMYRIGRALGLTARATPGLKTAVEITAGFARYSPRDPVRYDFCLTRLGINPACRDEDFACLLSDPSPASPAAPVRGRRRS